MSNDFQYPQTPPPPDGHQPPPPPPGGYQPPPPPGGSGQGPNTTPYLVISAVQIVLCCWPLAVVSLVFAIMANSKISVGDSAGATANLRIAKITIIVNAVLVVLAIIVFIALALLGVFAESV